MAASDNDENGCSHSGPCGCHDCSQSPNRPERIAGAGSAWGLREFGRLAGTTRICRDANELWSNSSPANACTPWAFARATGHVMGAIGSAPRNVRSLPLRPVRASPVALPQSPTASVLMTGCRTSATWYAMPSQRSGRRPRRRTRLDRFRRPVSTAFDRIEGNTAFRANSPADHAETVGHPHILLHQTSRPGLIARNSRA